jgi:hypothetical protein
VSEKMHRKGNRGTQSGPTRQKEYLTYSRAQDSEQTYSRFRSCLDLYRPASSIISLQRRHCPLLHLGKPSKIVTGIRQNAAGRALAYVNTGRSRPRSYLPEWKPATACYRTLSNLPNTAIVLRIDSNLCLHILLNPYHA